MKRKRGPAGPAGPLGGSQSVRSRSSRQPNTLWNRLPADLQGMLLGYLSAPNANATIQRQLASRDQVDRAERRRFLENPGECLDRRSRFVHSNLCWEDRMICTGFFATALGELQTARRFRIQIEIPKETLEQRVQQLIGQRIQQLRVIGHVPIQQLTVVAQPLDERWLALYPPDDADPMESERPSPSSEEAHPGEARWILLDAVEFAPPPILSTWELAQRLCLAQTVRIEFRVHVGNIDDLLLQYGKENQLPRMDVGNLSLVMTTDDAILDVNGDPLRHFMFTSNYDPGNLILDAVFRAPFPDTLESVGRRTLEYNGPSAEDERLTFPEYQLSLETNVY